MSRITKFNLKFSLACLLLILSSFLFANWELIDSVKTRTIIPAKTKCYIIFDDPIESLQVCLPYDSLTSLAREAVRRAPTWLRVDLEDNLRKLSQNNQDIYANTILSANHPFLDEICFQIAHISPHILESSDFYPQLLVENATYLYKIDSVLDYVEIINVYIPSDTNYYSTVRYRAVNENGDTIEIEYPKEIYYWYILHPKISREICTYVDSLSGNPLPPPAGKFWRGYLFYNADPGYPSLADYLIGEKTVWHSLRNDTANNGAIGAINNWMRRVMQFQSPPLRTYQPVQIYTQHQGTCTEWGILTPAAARSALIPCVHTRAYGNNHCWNEFYERRWSQWEPVNKMINDSTRYDPAWWNLAAACDWRGDGYWWTVSERYTPYCSLTVKVLDQESIPVDGARVAISGGPQPVTWFCAFGYTNKNGEAFFTLGDTNDYDAAVESEIGNISATRVINQAMANTHYRPTFILSGLMPHLRIEDDTFPPNPLDRYKVQVSIQVKAEVIYGVHPDDNSLFAKKETLSDIDFFVCDSTNFVRYLQGQDFRAFLISRDIRQIDTCFIFPTANPYYLIFSNDERIGNGTDLKVQAKLYKNVSGIKEEKTVLRKKEQSLFLKGGFVAAGVKIYDITGNLVKDSRRLSTGIYFIKSEARKFKKIVIR